jgi:hypothetical protein
MINVPRQLDYLSNDSMGFVTLNGSPLYNQAEHIAKRPYSLSLTPSGSGLDLDIDPREKEALGKAFAEIVHTISTNQLQAREKSDPSKTEIDIQQFKKNIEKVLKKAIMICKKKGLKLLSDARALHSTHFLNDSLDVLKDHQLGSGILKFFSEILNTDSQTLHAVMKGLNDAECKSFNVFGNLAPSGLKEEPQAGQYDWDWRTDGGRQTGGGYRIMKRGASGEG